MAGELKIYTLGNFKVANSEKVITENINKSSKRWKLLQYLITFNNQEISRDELIMILNLSKNDDPESSLSALVYRLRNLLNKYTNQGNGHFIKTSGSAYTFNGDANYWLDSEVFESKCQQVTDLIEQSSNQQSLNGVADLFQEALTIYQGDYLQEARSEEWLWSARNYYRDLLKNTTLKLDGYLKAREEYDSLLTFYDQIQKLIKFDEDVITSYLEALVGAGKESEARAKYQEIETMYEDNGLKVPPRLENIFRDLKIERAEQPEEFLSTIDEAADEEGAYLCTPDKFVELYELEKRRCQRDGPSRCIIHLRLNEEEKSRQQEMNFDHVDNIGNQFLQLLNNQLRSGDIVTRWDKKHFIILLANIECKDAEKVTSRIQNSFKARYGLPAGLSISKKIHKLSDEKLK